MPTFLFSGVSFLNAFPAKRERNNSAQAPANHAKLSGGTHKKYVKMGGPPSATAMGPARALLQQQQQQQQHPQQLRRRDARTLCLEHSCFLRR